MPGLLEGKAALVTGAASGIGRAIALAFAREGARVVAADLREDAAEATLRTLREYGEEVAYVTADVTRESDVTAMIATAVERHGPLDCAVNNAGITGSGGLVQDLKLSDWLHTLDVNLTSVFLCMKHELRVMNERGRGAIVNMASGAGLIAVPGLSPYCASKHGVLGLTKTAAVENAHSGIRVNAICPGSTDTPMLRAAMDRDSRLEKMILANQPGGRLGLPEEIAEAAVWLCSDRASFVTGESMLVDGGSVAR